MKNNLLPDYIQRYFWGDDVTSIDLQKNQKYIFQIILERGDGRAIKWLLSTFSRTTVKDFLPNLKLSKKSSTFWNIYLS